MHRGDYESACASTRRALATFREIGDKKGVIITLCNLGETLLALGRPIEARETLLENLTLAEEHGASRFRGNILSTLARIELMSGEIASAESYVRETLKSTPGDRPHATRTEVLTTLAETLLEVGRTEDANDALREAMDLTDLDPEYEKRAHLLSVRVRSSREREGPQEALAYATSTDFGSRASQEAYGLARLDTEVGVVYRELGPEWADRTEKHLERAVRAFANMGCRVESAQALGQLTVYWQLVGDEALAEECYEEGHALLDSAGLEYQREVFLSNLEAGAS